LTWQRQQAGFEDPSFLLFSVALPNHFICPGSRFSSSHRYLAFVESGRSHLLETDRSFKRVIVPFNEVWEPDAKSDERTACALLATAVCCKELQEKSLKHDR